MVANSKDFLKWDACILVVTLLYYLIDQFKITPDTMGSGYFGIFVFFTLEVAMQVAFQAMLIVYDLCSKKTMVVSVRSGAMVFMFGMGCIICGLGLLSPWLTIYLFGCEGLHLFLFLKSLKM